MTSRTPRETALRLVPRRPIAAARQAAEIRRSRPPKPPEGTPPTRELARMARAVLADAVLLARWTDSTLRPGPTGILPDADVHRASAALELTGRQVRNAWDRARLAGLVELRDGSVRHGWRLRVWNHDDAAVLRGWVALFDAWSLARPAWSHRASADADPGLVAEAVEAVPQLLSLLHLSSGPVPVDTLLDLLRQRVAELRAERDEPPAAGDRDPYPALLDWVIEALGSVGALRPRADDEVAVTPLGSWAVWVKLEQICLAAQTTEGHTERPAEELLRACARYSPGPARAEYRAWLAARPVGQAVAELLDVARGDDPLLRGLAFEALRVVGEPAAPAVRAVVHEPYLRPYAVLWLGELEDDEHAESRLTREEATWLWVDTAAAVSDHGEGHLLVSHLESAVQSTVPQLLAEVRTVDHPRTVQVLVALAAAHPDPKLSKALRRAAFQVHTGGSD
ncbi:hypothetical protein ACFV1B_24870 [Streptomyces sp. NPDC059637]|uniref:hypothetical protein n=1 Tax=Streptomyces TaxID=1883 RepID=UPI0031D30FC9